MAGNPLAHMAIHTIAEHGRKAHAHLQAAHTASRSAVARHHIEQAAERLAALHAAVTGGARLPQIVAAPAPQAEPEETEQPEPEGSPQPAEPGA